ncbi:MAG: hypothetical protein UIM53_03705 [Acutalibacteraceae bacterium]|nr:hypothetical protein [Acutalibacteraceae bacterium]
MNDKNYEIPLGLAMSLASNEQAMKQYSGMTKEERMAVQTEAKQALSKSEMKRIVQNIADGKFTM